MSALDERAGIAVDKHRAAMLAALQEQRDAVMTEVPLSTSCGRVGGASRGSSQPSRCRGETVGATIVKCATVRLTV